MHLTKSEFRFIAGILALLSLAPSYGQDLEFSQPVEVRLVEVEVFVTDGRGHPVLDLNQTEFDLLVDGEPHPITLFSGPSSSDNLEADRPSPTPGHIVIFIDSTNIESLQRNSMIKEIEKFLDVDRQLDYAFMVVSTTSTDFVVHQGFTTDSQALGGALEEIGRTLANDQRIAEYQSIFLDIQRISSAVQDFSGRGIAPQAQGLVGRIQAFSDSARDDAIRTAGYLWRLTDSLSGLPGRRSILCVGGVFSFNPGATLYAALRDVLGRRTGAEAQEAGAQLPAGIATDRAQNLQTLADHASSNGIAFYSITEPGRRGALGGGVSAGSLEAAPGDAPGAQDTWSPGVAFRGRSEARESVEILAAATGGLAQIGAKRVEPTIRRIYDDLASYYLLAFQPSHDSDGETHRIAVKVDRKKVDVRHRSYYQAMSWDQETANSIQSTLHFGEDSNPLEVRIDTGEVTTLDQRASRIPLSVQIPLSRLAVISGGPSHRAQVTLFYTTGSKNLATDPVRKVVLPIAIPNENLLEAIGQSINYRIDVDFGPGSDRVIVGVRDDLDDRLSTIRIWLPNGGS